jgi:hypothetical protein
MKNAVDVDVPEGQRDLEEEPHVVAQDDVAQGPRPLFVGAIAERHHGGIVAHEGHAPAFHGKAGDGQSTPGRRGYPAGATGNRVANSPRTIATPATDPGPLTHISIQILTKAGNAPNPSRMMW